MENLQVTTNAGTDSLLEQTVVEAFKDGLNGEMLQPGDEGYDQARTVWNAMINRHPAIIVRCADSADVISTVQFARTHNLLLSVRGGGHNVAGYAVCDGGVMLDFSLMKNVQVDTETRTVQAEPGLTWGELDKETQNFGLATTGGVVSHTGIAGLTFGGGVGWLMAQHGLSCDNLLSVNIVTAEGELLTANETQHADLFWAVRGGGGNFGVVTSFRFQLQPVGPTVLGGIVLYPMKQAREVLQFYREYARSGQDELTVFAALLSTEEGQPVVAIVVGWFGDPDKGEKHLVPLRNFTTPLADMIAPMPYCQLQTLFDPSAPFGINRYWKSGYFKHLTDELIDLLIEHTLQKTSPLTAVPIFHIHGAATRVSPEATAFGTREDQFDIDIIPQWTDPAEADKHINWARSFWQAIAPFSTGVYVNHLDADDSALRIKAAYRTSYERLVSLKNRYDPDNFFNHNNNIKPSVDR